MLSVALLASTAAAVSPGPNPIYDVASHSRFIAKVPNGVLYRVSAPGAADLDVMHVFGTAYDRGLAHGTLISATLRDFVGPQMDRFYGQQIVQLLGGCLEAGQPCSLPKWLVAALRLLKPTINRDAPKAFHLALGWLEELQRRHNNASAARVYDEIRGIADGACAAANAAAANAAATSDADPKRPGAAASAPCDAAALYTKLARLNVLPDLIKMQCTVLGAWGKATPDGKLTQLRALDFGDGPFANATLLIVHHPVEEEGRHPAKEGDREASSSSSSSSSAAAAAAPGVLRSQPFASLGFPGNVGVITGVSPHLAVSEKVNDLHGGGTPPGTYDGQTTTNVIRDMVQFGTSRASAEAIAARAKRTWGVWLGVGDAATQRLDVIRYQQASSDVFDDQTVPALTGWPRLDGVAYLDKHAQPSKTLRDPSLYDAIRARLGNLTGTTVAQSLPRLHRTGDVMVMVVDFSSGDTLVAKGTTAANMSFAGGREAFAAPFIRFPSTSLWKEPPPTVGASPY